MPDQRPIGIFDSGIGGLSVMRNIREMLPAEDIIYFADSAYCPYGTRSPEIARRRSLVLCDFLLRQNAKLIVVACNTASSAVLNELRKLHAVPVVGMEPALKPAAALTRNKKIGVLATGVTISGERFHSLVNRYGQEVQVLTQPCPGLVEVVEEGKMDSAEAGELLQQYLQPMQEEGVDTVVLGCTHYPFLCSRIRSILGTGVNIIDTGEAVARRVYQVMQEHSLYTPYGEPGTEKFFTSGDPQKVGAVIRKLLEDDSIPVKPADV